MPLKLDMIVQMEEILVPLPCASVVLDEIVVRYPLVVELNPILTALPTNGEWKLIKLDIVNRLVDEMDLVGLEDLMVGPPWVIPIDRSLLRDDRFHVWNVPSVCIEV